MSGPAVPDDSSPVLGEVSIAFSPAFSPALSPEGHLRVQTAGLMSALLTEE